MFQPISVLKLSRMTKTQFRKDGINYCTDANFRDIDKLTEATEIISCLDLLTLESHSPSFDTHNLELNELLKDAVKPGTITEFCGMPGSGKSQICFYLACATNVLCLFIDTRRSLSPERLEEILYRTSRSKNNQNIHHVEACTIVEFIAMINYLEHWLPENKINLLIVDSLTWPLRQVASKERTKLIYFLFGKLRSLANIHQFAIVLTNDLSTRIERGGSTSYTSSLGDAFYHIINTRILLSKISNGFSATTMKSSSTLKEKVTFRL